LAAGCAAVSLECAPPGSERRRILDSVRTEFERVRDRWRFSHQQRQATPEIQLRLVHVVRAASQLQILNDGLPTHGVRLDVVKLQETSL
jgi:hypothetical protein